MLAASANRTNTHRESLLCPNSQEHSGTASPSAGGSRYPSVGRSKSNGRGAMMLAAEDSHMSVYCYGASVKGPGTNISIHEPCWCEQF